MFFYICKNKSSCFIDLVYKSCVIVLMICSLKDVLKELTLDFVLLVLEAYFTVSLHSLSTANDSEWLTLYPEAATTGAL